MSKLTPQPCYIKHIKLVNFRNHEEFEFTSSGQNPIVIYGNNGLGKTNILEAISLLSPGKGFRVARNGDINYKKQTEKLWSIYTELYNGDEKICIGIANSVDSAGKHSKIIKLNGKHVSILDVMEYINIIWLVPQMDHDLITSSAVRRKFIDRFILNFNKQYAKTISTYDHLVRDRMKILKNHYDQQWLDVIENQIAALNLEIHHMRNKATHTLNQYIHQNIKYFIIPSISYECQMHNIINQESQPLDAIKKILYTNRTKDQMIKQTSFGIHKSDLCIVKHNQEESLQQSSTGEQRSMLIALVLAQCHAISDHYNRPPILLLDEIPAHLDHIRRELLYKEIADMNVQVWMTGTDKSLFADLSNNAHVQLVSI